MTNITIHPSSHLKGLQNARDILRSAPGVHTHDNIVFAARFLIEHGEPMDYSEGSMMLRALGEAPVGWLSPHDAEGNAIDLGEPPMGCADHAVEGLIADDRHERQQSKIRAAFPHVEPQQDDPVDMALWNAENALWAIMIISGLIAISGLLL